MNPQSEAYALKAFNTVLFIRRINRLKDTAIKIIGEKKDEPMIIKKPKPAKKSKKMFSMITTCLALFFITSCAPTHTAIIYCKAPTPVEDCVREDLGKKVKIVRVSKIDISTYMVDYK